MAGDKAELGDGDLREYLAQKIVKVNNQLGTFKKHPHSNMTSGKLHLQPPLPLSRARASLPPSCWRAQVSLWQMLVRFQFGRTDFVVISLTVVSRTHCSQCPCSSLISDMSFLESRWYKESDSVLADSVLEPYCSGS